MASNVSCRHLHTGDLIRRWRKRLGMASTKVLGRAINTPFKTIYGWEEGTHRPPASVETLFRYLELTKLRQMPTAPEHLIGYDPDTGTRFVVRLLEPGLIIGADDTVIWLDPPSNYDNLSNKAAVAAARLLLISLE